MYLIVGLGNPEEEYKNTRHNMGFDTINKISQKYDIKVVDNKFKGLVGKGIIENEKVILLKPQTFMNLSGESIQECMNFYKIEPDNLIVIFDDMDIEPGTIKVRKQGGAGSHNGMKSVIACINEKNFARVRIGIGTPEYKEDRINYVIGRVSEEELDILKKGVDTAAEAVVEIVKNGIDAAMNKFN